MRKRQTVHMVDDDETARETVGFFLDVAGYEARGYASGPEFLAAVDLARPGCVLLDIHMPEMTGLELQAHLRERHIGWPIIVLTGRGDIGIAVQAMKAGAFEFFEKPYQTESLLGSLSAAFAQLESTRKESERISEARSLIETLTGREREVIRGLLAGMSNKVIAFELDISVRTVEIYRANVMYKLGAGGLSMAVRIALAAGLQPLGEPAPVEATEGRSAHATLRRG